MIEGNEGLVGVNACDSDVPIFVTINGRAERTRNQVLDNRSVKKLDVRESQDL